MDVPVGSGTPLNDLSALLPMGEKYLLTSRGSWHPKNPAEPQSLRAWDPRTSVAVCLLPLAANLFLLWVPSFCTGPNSYSSTPSVPHSPFSLTSSSYPGPPFSLSLHSPLPFPLLFFHSLFLSPIFSHHARTPLLHSEALLHFCLWPLQVFDMCTRGLHRMGSD